MVPVEVRKFVFNAQSTMTVISQRNAFLPQHIMVPILRLLFRDREIKSTCKRDHFARVAI